MQSKKGLSAKGSPFFISHSSIKPLRKVTIQLMSLLIKIATEFLDFEM
jgi:hypothetical protein